MAISQQQTEFFVTKGASVAASGALVEADDNDGAEEGEYVINASAGVTYADDGDFVTDGGHATKGASVAAGALEEEEDDDDDDAEEGEHVGDYVCDDVEQAVGDEVCELVEKPADGSAEDVCVDVG